MIKAIINEVTYEYCKDCTFYHKVANKRKKKKACNRKVLLKK